LFRLDGGAVHNDLADALPTRPPRVDPVP